MEGGGNGKLFSGYRVSILQDGKSSEDYLDNNLMCLMLLNLHLNKKVNFVFCVFCHNF